MSRYDRVAAWLHWAIGIALLGEIAFGLLLDEIAPRGTPARAGVINLHKSIGVVLGVLIVVRIAWRLAHKPPPWPASMPTPPAARRPTSATQRFTRAWWSRRSPATSARTSANSASASSAPFCRPGDPTRRGRMPFSSTSTTRARMLLLALTAGHVAFALKHALVERDGVFERIVPWSSTRNRAPST